MFRIFNVIPLVCIVCLLGSCKRYDGDATNRKLIQGKWKLVDVEHEYYDSIRIDYDKQSTYLVFDRSDCTQLMPGTDTSYYTFSIHNYTLFLYIDSIFDNRLDISVLTSDSLILSRGIANRWKYRRMEE
ncbi:MAG: hypothetical protein LBN74_08555 [Prevotella sp.]|jgi:hypothetical protein|nr:hypothetical protein [Prevotella sp.]